MIRPNDTDWQLAGDIFSQFRRKPGAEHIASEFALAHLSALLRETKPRAVLEIGAGIGTVTRLIIEHADRPDRLTVTENHPYCLRQLERNVPQANGYRLVVDQADLDPDTESYDTVIVDGSIAMQCLSFLRPGVVCFIEGGRQKTRDAIRKSLSAQGLDCHFEAYKPARRPLSYDKEWDRRAGRARRRLRIFSPKKGCWIGAVATADTHRP